MSDEEIVTKEAETAEIPTASTEDVAVVLPNRDLQTGMLVRVHEKIKDFNAKGEERERVQIFEGIVMGVKGPGMSRTMTVRKNSNGWMVEKIYPLSSPNIEKVEVVKQYKTRRGKLSFLRGRFRRKMVEQVLEEQK